jgi:hypothetical protein
MLHSTRLFFGTIIALNILSNEAMGVKKETNATLEQVKTLPQTFHACEQITSNQLPWLLMRGHVLF